jgi:hypothetical protein
VAGFLLIVNCSRGERYGDNQKFTNGSRSREFFTNHGNFLRSREFLGALAESDICEPYIGLARISAHMTKWGRPMTKMETPVFSAAAGPGDEDRTLRPAG